MSLGIQFGGQLFGTRSRPIQQADAFDFLALHQRVEDGPGSTTSSQQDDLRRQPLQAAIRHEGGNDTVGVGVVTREPPPVVVDGIDSPDRPSFVSNFVELTHH